MKLIIEELFTFLSQQSSRDLLNANTYSEIKTMDRYKGQDIREDRSKQLPFSCPAVMVRFAINYNDSGDNTQDAAGEITIHVLQEDYANSQWSSDNRDKSLQTIDFVDYLNELIHGHRFSFGSLRRRRWEDDNDASNIVHDRLTYQVIYKDQSTAKINNLDKSDGDGDVSVKKQLKAEMPVTDYQVP